jgi:hypothetical protein
MPAKISGLLGPGFGAVESQTPELACAPIVEQPTEATWTRYLDTKGVSKYLRAQGIPVAIQTLAHQRSMGFGIRWKYLGQRAITTKEEVDRFVAQDLLRDESPLTRRSRKQASPAEKPQLRSGKSKQAAVRPRGRGRAIS